MIEKPYGMIDSASHREYNRINHGAINIKKQPIMGCFFIVEKIKVFKQ